LPGGASGSSEQRSGADWTYNIEENRYKLAVLEDKQILTVPLRRSLDVIRKLHGNGDTVTFPIPDAVDRITLKIHNLPNEPGQLLRLIDEVFERRNEDFDLNEVYNDFVRAHGRVLLDIKESWPHCYVHTKFPT